MRPLLQGREMVHALTGEQVGQIVNQTILVLLARPELVGEWRANLLSLLQQAREQVLEDEMIFVAAVISLLNSPRDRLPTGTVYDYAWESLLAGLATGGDVPVASELDQLLLSIAQATLAVLKHAPDQRELVAQEVQSVFDAAHEADMPELIAWLTDVLALLNGAAPDGLGAPHQGVYAAYWDALVRNLMTER